MSDDKDDSSLNGENKKESPAKSPKDKNLQTRHDFAKGIDSKEKIEELKGEVKKKRRRRRRKKKNKESGEFFTGDFPQKESRDSDKQYSEVLKKEENLVDDNQIKEEKEALGLSEDHEFDEENLPEVFKEAKEEQTNDPVREFESPEYDQQSQDLSVNPFEADLPPSTYEETQRFQQDKTVSLNHQQKEDSKSEDFASFGKSANPFEASNPFAPPAGDFGPAVSDKPLDEKPLDRFAPESEDEWKENETKSAEEMKYADEQNSENEGEFQNPFVGVGQKAASDQSEFQKNTDDNQELADEDNQPVNRAPLPSTAHVEVVDKSREQNQQAEIEEFKESFWDILQQSGFTKTRIVSFLIVFILIVLIALGFIFGWFGGIFDFVLKDRDLKQVSDEIEVPVIDGVSNGYIFGFEFNPDENPLFDISRSSLSGIESAFVFGESAALAETKFIEYVDLLKKMRNIFETDIYALLDQNTDRPQALEDHLHEMKMIIMASDRAFLNIADQLAILESEYALSTGQRDAYEEAFFINMDNLFGKQAYDNLQSFINLSQKTQNLKAKFGALKTLGERMGISLDALEPRYQDILSNREALIKGVRVFDFPRSDIDAIVPIEQ